MTPIEQLSSRSCRFSVVSAMLPPIRTKRELSLAGRFGAGKRRHEPNQRAKSLPGDFSISWHNSLQLNHCRQEAINGRTSPACEPNEPSR
ncbi:hypothetical protein AVEN_234055-1 [Araneus ventricosus]|uniref:Uncharacterized protein n=1 Tax=Araneus ventricosus TaxID=182803 RepID=A0A4Y2VIK2_ARAVE|nr:hypothetical protein AVEN_234055-1 [Araneus ventricosus]